MDSRGCGRRLQRLEAKCEEWMGLVGIENEKPRLARTPLFFFVFLSMLGQKEFWVGA